MNKDISIILKLLHKIGVHAWKLSHQTGLYQYNECQVCGKREYVKLVKIHGPVDYKWLTKGKTKNLSSKPPGHE